MFSRKREALPALIEACELRLANKTIALRIYQRLDTPQCPQGGHAARAADDHTPKGGTLCPSMGRYSAAEGNADAARAGIPARASETAAQSSI